MRRPLVVSAVVAVVFVGVVSGARLAQGEQPTKRLSDLARGKELYDRHCIQCHGPLNDGQGPAATALVTPAPDLQGLIKADDFDRLVTVILDGKGAMPSFVNSFDKYDARRALRHMASLGPDSATPEGDDEEGDDDDNDDAPAVEGPPAEGE